MLKSKIAPSVMCAPLADTEKVLDVFAQEDIELLHADVMDGEFVPNLMLGPDYCRQLRRLSAIPLDYHFMVTHLSEKIRWFPFEPGDYVSYHAEALRDEAEGQWILDYLRSCGVHPLLAIKPATPLEAARPWLEKVDGLLVMTVEPGFAGQKLVPGSFEKLSATRAQLDGWGLTHLEIEVDGNVSFENARHMRAAGANIFVAGSSSVFRPGDLRENIAALRAAIGQEKYNI